MKQRTRVLAMMLTLALGILGACGGNSSQLRSESTQKETPSAGPTASAPPHPSPEPSTIFTGQFRSLAPYKGSGQAQLIANPDGSRVVRFLDFEVSKGPALHIYLSAATSDSPGEKFDDDFADLGVLKSTTGTQDYGIPSNVDPSRFRSVVVWCTEFSVGFTVAPIA